MILEKNQPTLTWGTVRTRQAHILLDRSRGDLDLQFEEFATNAFGTPQTILLRQPLDQGDGLRGKFRTTAAVARFEFPEEPKALPMPVLTPYWALE